MNILFVIPLSMSHSDAFKPDLNTSDIKASYTKHHFQRRLKAMYPMGALSVAAYLKKQIPDINIKMIDLNSVLINRDLSKISGPQEYTLGNLLEESFSMVEGFTPDIIGISALWTTVFGDLKPLASFLRKHYPDSLITCGGHLATTVYKNIYNEDISIDALCFGEGEIPFYELAEAVSAGKANEYLSFSPCWITQEKAIEKKDFVPQGKLIVDLDEIPVLDLGILIHPNEYFHPHHSFFELEPQDPKRMFIFTTRGCPNRCIFCASHMVHGRKVRYHSAERMKKDITHYHKQYGATKFVFFDDHFLIKKERAVEILRYVSENGFTAEIVTPAFFAIDADIVAAMKDAGIKSVNLTIENGNKDTLKDIIHKPGSLEKAEEAVDLFHAKGMVVMTNILTGFPGETKESIEEGLRYLLTTKFNWFQLYTVAPLPGTELYKICQDNGYLTSGKDFSSISFFSSCIQTPDFTPEYINTKVYEMNLKLNFINNYDMRAGNYDIALFLFEKLISTINDKHAFAYYFAAKCCQKLNLDQKRKRYEAKYEELVSKDLFWKEWSARLLSS